MDERMHALWQLVMLKALRGLNWKMLPPMSEELAEPDRGSNIHLCG